MRAYDMFIWEKSSPSSRDTDLQTLDFNGRVGARTWQLTRLFHISYDPGHVLSLLALDKIRCTVTSSVELNVRTFEVA